MDYQLKRINRVPVYEGRVFTAFQDTMELPGGRQEKWDFIEHHSSGAAVVGELPGGDQILLVRQLRPAINMETLELPAGKREKDPENADAFEDTRKTAARELREETGYSAGSLEKLVTVHSAPAYNTEFTDIYLARDLRREGNLIPDEAEEISVVTVSRKEARRLVFAGEITDAKTVAGILAWLTT